MTTNRTDELLTTGQLIQQIDDSVKIDALNGAINRVCTALDKLENRLMTTADRIEAVDKTLSVEVAAMKERLTVVENHIKQSSWMTATGDFLVKTKDVKVLQWIAGGGTLLAIQKLGPSVLETVLGLLK